MSVRGVWVSSVRDVLSCGVYVHLSFMGCSFVPYGCHCCQPQAIGMQYQNARYCRRCCLRTLPFPPHNCCAFVAYHCCSNNGLLPMLPSTAVVAAGNSALLPVPPGVLHFRHTPLPQQWLLLLALSTQTTSPQPPNGPQNTPIQLVNWTSGRTLHLTPQLPMATASGSAIILQLLTAVVALVSRCYCLHSE